MDKQKHGGDLKPEYDRHARLFPAKLAAQQWVQFKAEGFSHPVTGVIYRNGTPAASGVPLGGLGTGCIDLDLTATLGYSTIFNDFVPPHGPHNLPFLGMSIGERTWVLSTVGILGAEIKGMDYWGHYPVADIEYETDAPVSVGVRAWSPFIPGDTPDSMIPGAVFDVHLRNHTAEPQDGALAFNFPGFVRKVQYPPVYRTPIESDVVSGILARSGNEVEYCLGVIGEQNVRTGRGLGLDAAAWHSIGTELPGFEVPDHDTSACSVSVDFSLAPNESKVVKFVLSWYTPRWYGNGDRSPSHGGNPHDHMYATRYKDATQVAEKLAKKHDSLLRRILAWQEVVYSEKSLPGWLRDSLVNVLHLITETALWCQKGEQEWCRGEDGIFGMNECPRACPQMECIPCSLYGNLPVVYFFPDAALSHLRTEKAYQYPNGRPAWIFGPAASLTEPNEGYQFILNGSCLVELIDKMWLRTGNNEILTEFYDAAKRATQFTMTLRPAYGDKQVVSMPTGNVGDEWYESVQFRGFVSHVGGIHLAHLRMMKRMAESVGDDDFAAQCNKWLEAGSETVEETLWTGSHYLLFYEPETESKSDLVLAYVLDGEWMARFHGLPGVFKADRVKTTLETLARCNANPEIAPHGALVFCQPDGTNAPEDVCGYWTPRGTHTPGDMILGMTYIYEGDRDFGIDHVRGVMNNLVNRVGGTWDSPILVRADTGDRIYGNDYYQNLMLWSMPAALAGQDLAGPCEPGGLVDRVLRAGADMEAV